MRNFKFLLAAAFLLPAAFSARAQSPGNDAERQLFDALNHERAAQALPPLQWDNSLADAARLHANRMASYNVLEHQLSGEPDLATRLAQAGARFSMIAENIAVGSTPQTIHSGWMQSPGHRRNILDAHLTAVGIAAVRGSGGLFAVQDFSQSAANLDLGQQEEKVILLLKARGFRAANATEAARKTCGMTSGFAGDRRPHSVIRYETADLSKFPEEVAKEIRNEVPSKAAVGACSRAGTAGFAHYRIAVLFF